MILLNSEKQCIYMNRGRKRRRRRWMAGRRRAGGRRRRTGTMQVGIKFTI
jgi:hypothetical protein